MFTVAKNEIEMQTYQSVAIVGMMGSGKTSIAKRLASKLKVPHIDTDREIFKLTGMSVKHLLDSDQENQLQTIEYEILKKYSGKKCIISTGDYTVMNQKAWDYLMFHSLSVWININPTSLIKRLKINGNRPFFEETTNLDAIKDLYNKRKKKYSKAKIHLKVINAYKIAELIRVIQEYLPE